MTKKSPMLVAAVKFKWQKDDKTYDYFIPNNLELKPGDKVVVETKRGDTTVEVVEIRDTSEKEEKSILRIFEEPAPVDGEGEKSEDWNF